MCMKIDKYYLNLAGEYRGVFRIAETWRLRNRDLRKQEGC